MPVSRLCSGRQACRTVSCGIVSGLFLDGSGFAQGQTAKPHLRPVLLTAYQLGQRFREIVSLTWDRVDLKWGFITLRSQDTKTKTGRRIPMTPDVRATFQCLAKVRSLTNNHVFTYKGRQLQ